MSRQASCSLHARKLTTPSFLRVLKSTRPEPGATQRWTRAGESAQLGHPEQVDAGGASERPEFRSAGRPESRSGRGGPGWLVCVPANSAEIGPASVEIGTTLIDSKLVEPLSGRKFPDSASLASNSAERLPHVVQSMWPMPGQLETPWPSKPPQSSSSCPRIRPSSTEFDRSRRNLGRNRPKSGQPVEIGRHLVGLGQIWSKPANVDPTQANLGRARARFGRTRAGLTKVGPMLAQLKQILVEVGRCRANVFSKNGPDFGRLWSEFGQIWPSVGRIAVEIGRTRDPIDQLLGDVDGCRVKVGPASALQNSAELRPNQGRV